MSRMIVDFIGTLSVSTDEECNAVVAQMNAEAGASSFSWNRVPWWDGVLLNATFENRERLLQIASRVDPGFRTDVPEPVTWERAPHVDTIAADLLRYDEEADEDEEFDVSYAAHTDFSEMHDDEEEEEEDGEVEKDYEHDVPFAARTDLPEIDEEEFATAFDAYMLARVVLRNNSESLNRLGYIGHRFVNNENKPNFEILCERGCDKESFATAIQTLISDIIKATKPNFILFIEQDHFPNESWNKEKEMKQTD